LGRFLAGSTAHAVAPVEAVAHAVEHPQHATRNADLSVIAAAGAPVMITAPTPQGGATALETRAVHADVMLGAVARATDTHLETASVDVPMALDTASRNTLLVLAAEVGRTAAGTIRAGVSHAVARIVPTRAHRLKARPGDPLFSQARPRIDWERVGRERLLRAWKGVLREHGLPSGDVRLVGVFGPAPLGAVDGVALAADGESAVIAFRATRAPGPAGDVALARHVPTGRLLTVLVPPPAQH
jgi:hypothetical protein